MEYKHYPWWYSDRCSSTTMGSRIQTPSPITPNSCHIDGIGSPSLLSHGCREGGARGFTQQPITESCISSSPNTSGQDEVVDGITQQATSMIGPYHEAASPHSYGSPNDHSRDGVPPGCMQKRNASGISRDREDTFPAEGIGGMGV